MLVRFVVLTHEDRKLFYVCTHDVNSKTILGWKNVALKSKAAYMGRSSNNMGGVNIAMVNTDYFGWENTFIEGEFDKGDDRDGEYLEKKTEIIEKYEALGYVNVGKNMKVSNRTGVSDIPMGWSRPFNVNTMTKEKIMEKIGFINLSLQKKIPASLVNAVYLEIAGVRKTSSFEVKDMSSLLKFVRIKLDLEPVLGTNHANR